MKLVVKTDAHGIKKGEYKDDALKKLLTEKRHNVTSLVARRQAHWDHEDKKPEAATTTAKADKPTT